MKPRPASRRPAVDAPPARAPLRSPKQARSESSTGAVLDAAARLIAEHGIDATSVAAVAHAAGSSVGAIYFRFGDKERLVAAVLERVIGGIVAEIDLLFADSRAAGDDARALLARYVTLAVTVFRRQRGLMRALFAQSLTRPEAFDPWRRLGVASRTRVVEVLRARGDMALDEEAELRVLAGLQMAYGTLLNAVMARTWPLDLDDPRLEAELTHMLLRYANLPEARAAPARRTRRSA